MDVWVFLGWFAIGCVCFVVAACVLSLSVAIVGKAFAELRAQAVISRIVERSGTLSPVEEAED